MGKLIIDGNSVYEVDENCIKEKEDQRQREMTKEKIKEEPKNTLRKC